MIKPGNQSAYWFARRTWVKNWQICNNIAASQTILSVTVLCVLVGNMFLIMKNIKVDHLDPNKTTWLFLIQIPFRFSTLKNKCENADQKFITNTPADVHKVFKIGKLWIKLRFFLNTPALNPSTIQKSNNENTEVRPTGHYGRADRRHEKCKKRNIAKSLVKC